MIKNIKSIFFILTLVMLLVTVGAVCASDDSNSTTATDSSVSDIVTVSDTATDSVAAEPVKTTSDDNKVDTKTIEKEEKNLKRETKTIEVNNFKELNTALKIVASDFTCEEYNIDLVTGPFEGQWDFYNIDIQGSVKKITINGNNQSLSQHFTYFKNLDELILNNLKINPRVITTSNIMKLNNCTINSAIIVDGNLIIDNNTIFDENANITCNNIICENMTKVLPYIYKLNCDINITNFTFNNDIIFTNDVLLKNCSVNSKITNEGNLIITNSNLIETIENNGNITISNCTINENTFGIIGQGDFFVDDLAKYFPYIYSINGKNELNDYTINKSFTNNGELTLNNCILNSSIINNGKIIIDDETIFGENLMIDGEGEIIINNTNKIAPYLSTYNEEYTIENMTINSAKTNNGKLTIINSTINSRIANNGNLTIINSTINSEITNNGNLTITDDCTIGENCHIGGNGQLIMNDTTRVGIYSGNIIKNNTVLNSPITIPNKANVTFINSNITAPIANNGNLTFTNCLINTQIINYANLTMNNCSLSNNNMTVSGTMTEGFFINNRGNASLIGCSVENNTFNTTARQIYLNNYPLSGAIANKGNLIVNNCIFQNNTVGYKIHVNDGSYFGTDYCVGDASCIFNNGGNLTVNNSLFKDNYAGRDAGAILSTNNYSDYWHINLVSEANLFINNTSFINNTANNTNIGVNITGINNIIENSTFTDTNIQANNLTLNNNTINNNTIIDVADTLNMSSNTINKLNINAMNIFATANTLRNGSLLATGSAEIINNTFTDQASLSLINAKTVTIHDNQFTDNNYTYDTITLPQNKSNTQIYNNTYTNTGLNDNITWNIAPKLYLNDTISATYTITNPENYDENIQDNITFNIYLDNQLQTTTDTLENIPLNKTGQITISIKPNKSSQTFTQYLDVLKIQDITITPENYDTYIKEGTLTKVKEDNRALFTGNFTNKGEIYIDTDDIVIDGTNAHFTNTTFTIDSQNTIIKNMNINNTDTTYPIDNHGKNNYIINNNINITNTDGPTAAIKNTATKTTIQNNTLYVDGPAKSIDYTENGIANTQAILIQNTNRNTITNNNITVTTTQESQTYGTIEAITANTVTDTTIKQNNINISNAKFTYGINMLASVTDNIITENNITATSYRYCDGIQVGNQAQNIEISKNNINIYCHNTTPVDEEAISYGIITSNMGQGTSTQINITQNNITIDSTVGYGIEIYQTTNTEIRKNTINVTGAYSMGIGYAHSPNSHVVANNIYTRGDSSQTLGAVTEEIQPENVGIKIQQDSTNIKIDDGWIYGRNPIGPNIIHTNDKAGNDYAINVESTGATIESNKLRCSNGTGDNAIKNNTTYYSSTGNGFDNIYVNIDIKTPETIILNQTTPITITIKDEYNNNIQLGEYDYSQPINPNTYEHPMIKSAIPLTITINNQTENITITEDTTTYYWTPTTPGTQDIKLTFTEKQGYKVFEDGTNQYVGTYNTTTTTKTVTISTIELYVEPITTTASDIINITAKIQIDNQTATDITKGKVTFKVNGKTLKDANGKVIYAKVVNGTATIENYIVLQDWAKEGTTIQAVYSGSTQCAKLTSEKTNITITPKELTLTTTATQAAPGQTTTLAATLSDNTINTGKIVFKINGKTVKDTNGKVIYAKVTNGTVSVDYTLPESYKAGNYTVTATFIASGYDRLEATETLTVTA